MNNKKMHSHANNYLINKKMVIRLPSTSIFLNQIICTGKKI